MRDVSFLVTGSSKYFAKNNVNVDLLLHCMAELFAGRLHIFEVPAKYRTIISVFLFGIVEHRLSHDEVMEDEEA